MRKPLERRVSAFCRPRLVAIRFACAFADEMLLTAENEAMSFLLESRDRHPSRPAAAGVGPVARRAGNRRGKGGLERAARPFGRSAARVSRGRAAPARLTEIGRAHV